MEDLLSFLFLVFAVIGVVVLAIGFSAVITMWAWNIIVPVIFGLGKITFLQAVGVNVLLGLLTNRVRVSK